jgi:hypothetical protein
VPSSAITPTRPAFCHNAKAARSEIEITRRSGNSFWTVASAIHGFVRSRARASTTSKNNSEARGVTPAAARISSRLRCFSPVIATVAMGNPAPVAALSRISLKKPMTLLA